MFLFIYLFFYLFYNAQTFSGFRTGCKPGQVTEDSLVLSSNNSIQVFFSRTSNSLCISAG